MWTKNRGMFLESMINRTLKFYATNEIALFHKKHIDITFDKITRNNGKLEINKGWINTKSTTDYYGVLNGKFVAFEAKSTNGQTLPITNIKRHQIKYIEQINSFGGLGFFIIYYGVVNKFYLLQIEQLSLLTRKSITPQFASEYGYEIPVVYPGILDFAPIIHNLK